MEEWDRGDDRYMELGALRRRLDAMQDLASHDMRRAGHSDTYHAGRHAAITEVLAMVQDRMLDLDDELHALIHHQDEAAGEDA